MSVVDVVTALAGARKAVQLYPESHPAFSEAINTLVSSVDEETAAGPLQLNVHQGHLYHESEVLSEDTIGHEAVAEAFESHAIESLTMLPGFAAEDAVGLVEVLTLRPGPDLDIEAELVARSVSNVSVATLEEDDEEREERDRQREADRAMYHRILSALRTLTARLNEGSGTGLAQTSELVGNLLSRLAEDQPAVLALATVRGQTDRNLFHSLNVMIFTLALGHRLGLPDEGLQSLGTAALLHDIGKVAFDIDDPAQTEYAELMHPKVGADILGRLELEDPAPLLVAWEHHMKPDGTGFPERDAEYVAHPYSRMVQIADRYENLVDPPTTDVALTPDRAVVQILKEAGTDVDPFFARLFANALGVFPVGSMVRLSDHSVGVVCRPGDDPLAPIVRLAFDARGYELDDPAEIDLSETDLRILEVVEPDTLRVAVSEKL
jgi:HD-GYP domain-containing protein (c-di-GMP phosphodiesterase class II)